MVVVAVVGEDVHQQASPTRWVLPRLHPGALEAVAAHPESSQSQRHSGCCSHHVEGVAARLVTVLVQVRHRCLALVAAEGGARLWAVLVMPMAPQGGQEGRGEVV